jgi:hypothetical protein
MIHILQAGPAETRGRTGPQPCEMPKVCCKRSLTGPFSGYLSDLMRSSSDHCFDKLSNILLFIHLCAVYILFVGLAAHIGVE